MTIATDDGNYARLIREMTYRQARAYACVDERVKPFYDASVIKSFLVPLCPTTPTRPAFAGAGILGYIWSRFKMDTFRG